MVILCLTFEEQYYLYGLKSSVLLGINFIFFQDLSIYSTYIALHCIFYE